ncbi:MAG TPA: MFS transporter [Candidatus Saccharimonadales bacterium]|nr:MFS transporter [Candidatus Saccharimonadales bacterium]
MKQKHTTIILLLLALSQFLVVLDSAIINVALPAIKEALHFSDAALQWVVTAYILTFGGFLMLGGRTADLFGRRRVLVSGIAGFTVFSLLLGLSQNSEMLITLRALQGLSAAFMAPAALSILLTTFKEGHERNKALSIWSVVGSGGAAAGVFLGGILTEYLGWQWNFFVNVPLGILTIWGIMKFVPAHMQEAKDRHLDFPGAALVTSGLMALVYALTQAPETGWTSTSTLLPLGLSILLLIGFLVNESRVKHPLVPLNIFKTRNVTGGNLIMLPVMAGGLGLFFFSSLYIQNVLQYSPVMSGLSFLPIPIIIGLVSTRSPKLIERFGFKALMVTGVSLTALGTLLLSFLGAESSYVFHLLPAFILMGVGLGLSFVSVTIAATSGVKPEQSGLASGLINTSQQIGGALGIAILAVVASTGAAAGVASGMTELQASLQGYQQAFFWAAMLMVAALFVAIFVIRQPKKSVGQQISEAISVH